MQAKQDKQDKKERLQAIRRIVSARSVESQEDLLAELAKEGFVSTQTTLSRDLKQLRISKVRVRNGHSVYALPRDGHFATLPEQQLEANAGKWRIQFSGNIMVLHTPPGHASMVAYDIDNVSHPFFLGTVAGDDTVLVVLAETVDRDAARRVIATIVPKMK